MYNVIKTLIQLNALNSIKHSGDIKLVNGLMELNPG